MERASQRRPPEPLALRLEDRVDARAHAPVARGPAGALVDLLRDRHLDLSEDVVLEGRHLGRGAEGDEDSRLQLLARGERDVALPLVLEPAQLGLERAQARFRFLSRERVRLALPVRLLGRLHRVRELLAALVELLLQPGDGLPHRLAGPLAFEPERVAAERAADVFGELEERDDVAGKADGVAE